MKYLHLATRCFLDCFQQYFLICYQFIIYSGFCKYIITKLKVGVKHKCHSGQAKKLVQTEWTCMHCYVWCIWFSCCCMMFNAAFNSTYFSYIAEASAPIHAFLIPALYTIFFPSHWLLSHKTIVEKTDSSETGMNPVTMTIISPQKEYWPSRRSRQPPVLKSATLPTELWGSKHLVQTKHAQ